ncbi:MAG: radical SAM protein [Bacteroidales bacterium]|nr:radical SAM protein [Bacteroidales bacterium]
MLREETVFGPIHSRRLGNSLGINLLPTKGKICNFDCIYCECGWNADGRGDTVLPTASRVRAALEDKLTALLLDGTPVDSITFSGDGEPTLNPEFPRIIDDTLKLRDAFYPGAKVSVLSNATRAHVPEVFEALRKVDNPIMKIDAPTDELAALINRPAPGYSVERTVEALKRFNGDFILQTMFLRARKRSIDGPTPAEYWFDSGAPEVLNPWMDIVRTLRPRQVQVYSIDRPTPASGLEKYSVDEMKVLVQPLLDEGFNIQFR